MDRLRLLFLFLSLPCFAGTPWEDANKLIQAECELLFGYEKLGPLIAIIDDRSLDRTQEGVNKQHNAMLEIGSYGRNGRFALPWIVHRIALDAGYGGVESAAVRVMSQMMLSPKDSEVFADLLENYLKPDQSPYMNFVARVIPELVKANVFQGDALEAFAKRARIYLEDVFRKSTNVHNQGSALYALSYLRPFTSDLIKEVISWSQSGTDRVHLVSAINFRDPRLFGDSCITLVRGASYDTNGLSYFLSGLRFLLGYCKPGSKGSKN